MSDTQGNGRGTPVERRFKGAVALVILNLRRVAFSNDMDEGIAMAKQRGMINEENESFLRSCFMAYEALMAGEELEEEVTQEMVDELHACVLRLNTADSA